MRALIVKILRWLGFGTVTDLTKVLQTKCLNCGWEHKCPACGKPMGRCL